MEQRVPNMGCPRHSGNINKGDGGAVITQRVFSDDVESKRARAQAALKSYKGMPLDDRLMIAPVTDDVRHRNMESWKT
jgi:hypothetical protein